MTATSLDGSRDTFVGLFDEFSEVRQERCRFLGDGDFGLRFFGRRLTFHAGNVLTVRDGDAGINDVSDLS